MNQIKEIAQKMIEIRHHLHANPELSFKEYATSAYITSILSRHNIYYEKVAQTGVLAVIEGTGQKDNNKDILIRADIDALPITEETTLEYRSVNGAMHACGHDIHTSILLGVLIYLSTNKDSFSGKVIGLFQPGEEESPGGASMIIKEKVLDKFNIKTALALHTAHDMPVGNFGVREGIYMASTSEMRINIEGSGGHAALPINMTNPILSAAQLITELKKLEHEYSEDAQPVIIAVGRVIADGSTNIIPSLVSLEGTIRAMSLRAKADIKSRINTIAKNIAFNSETKINVTFTDGYPPVRNDLGLAIKARDILIETYGSDHIKELAIRMTADDFGFFSELYPSFYYRLGVMKNGDECHSPHTSKFTADDSSIYFGIDSMVKLIIDLPIKL